jgi:sugar phosphate isomerase/epimerase
MRNHMSSKPKLTRRFFLQQTTLAAGGLLLGTACTAEPATHPIGIQLYTLRDLAAKDLSGTLQKIADAGYTDVETFGLDGNFKFFGFTPTEVFNLLKKYKLKSTSGHYLPENYLFQNGSSDIWKKTIEAAATLQQEYVTIPFMPESARKGEGLKKFIDKMNEAALLCKEAGLKLAYHNHEFEFETEGNSFPLEMMLKGTDAGLVDFELDIYWAVFAGRNPIDLFKKFQGRIALWHVKDMHRSQRNKNIEVGSGTIDYAAIFKAKKLSGLKHFYVEQENFEIDPIESIQQSKNYISKQLL